jgi:hypothetical protein
MSNLETLVNSTKQLESSLVIRLGATGRGLHEKVSSVERQLPAAIVKKIRYIATIRNKALHEDGFTVSDVTEIKAMSDLVLGYIEGIASPAPASEGSNVVRLRPIPNGEEGFAIFIKLFGYFIAFCVLVSIIGIIATTK